MREREERSTEEEYGFYSSVRGGPLGGGGSSAISSSGHSLRFLPIICVLQAGRDEERGGERGELPIVAELHWMPNEEPHQAPWDLMRLPRPPEHDCRLHNKKNNCLCVRREELVAEEDTPTHWN